MSLLVIILIIVALLALCGGGIGYRRYNYAPATAFSPFVLLLVVLLILWWAGAIR